MIGKRKSIKKVIYKHPYQNQVFDVVIKQSLGKSLILKLDAKNNIVVLKPFFINYQQCHEFITQNFSKIYQDLQKRKQNQKCNFAEGWCYLWGEKYEIMLHPETTSFMINKPYILLNKKKPLLHFKKLKKKMSKLIITEAKKILQEQNLTAEVSIKNLSRTWGICHKQKQMISLSAKLIHFNWDIIRYVIFHEVTHLIHPNHGPLFKKHLQTYVPHYKTLKKDLINW